MTPRPIGYQVTQTFCRACAPEGLVDFYEPMREGEDGGIPWYCDACLEPLSVETWEAAT